MSREAQCPCFLFSVILLAFAFLVLLCFGALTYILNSRSQNSDSFSISLSALPVHFCPFLFSPLLLLNIFTLGVLANMLSRVPRNQPHLLAHSVLYGSSLLSVIFELQIIVTLLLCDVNRNQVMFCNAGKTLVIKQRDLKGYGTLWFHAAGISNILSLRKWRRNTRLQLIVSK